MSTATVTINGVDYRFSKLRCKHLKKITEMLQEKKNRGIYEELERWMPLIGDSIRYENKDFSDDTLQEATLDEIANAWKTIVASSGIVFTGPKGEQTPENLTGQKSMEESAVQPAGTIAS